MSDLTNTEDQTQGSESGFDETLAQFGLDKYSLGSSASTLIDKLGDGLSTLQSTNSEFLAKGADWFQSYSEFYANKATEAASKAATTGNRIYGHIEDIYRGIATKFLNDAAALCIRIFEWLIHWLALRRLYPHADGQVFTGSSTSCRTVIKHRSYGVKKHEKV